jgi:hypothetical protein
MFETYQGAQPHLRQHAVGPASLREQRVDVVGRSPSPRRMAPQHEEGASSVVATRRNDTVREDQVSAPDPATRSARGPTIRLDSDIWDKFRVVKWDTRSHLGFLGEGEFDYRPAPAARRGQGRRHAPDPPPPPPPVVKVDEEDDLVLT